MNNPTPAWTDEDMAKPWNAEAAFLRHLAADPALNIEQAAMLRHCAKRLQSTSGIQLRALADMLGPAKQAGVLRAAADTSYTPPTEPLRDARPNTPPLLYALADDSGALELKGPYVLATEDEGQALRLSHTRGEKKISCYAYAGKWPLRDAGAVELLPCPFCGSEAKITGPEWVVDCSRPGVCSGHARNGFLYREDAITFWNSLAHPAPQQPAITDAVVEINDEMVKRFTAFARRMRAMNVTLDIESVSDARALLRAALAAVAELEALKADNAEYQRSLTLENEARVSAEAERDALVARLGELPKFTPMSGCMVADRDGEWISADDLARVVKENTDG